MRRDLCGHRQGQRAGGICGARLGAQPRPRFGTQAARALLSGPAGSSEQAVGLSSRRWHALPLLGGGGGSAHAARPPQRLPLQTLERHLRVMTSNPVASCAGSALEAHTQAHPALWPVPRRSLSPALCARKPGGPPCACARAWLEPQGVVPLGRSAAARGGELALWACCSATALMRPISNASCAP